jgi:hypothetical protein
MSEDLSNPSGLCMCQCGEKTAISSQTRTSRGWVAGEPRRYLRGHANRVRGGVPGKRAKLEGDRALPVLPTGLPCARAGCESPGLGDEFCSSVCAKLDHGVTWGLGR